MSCFWPLMMSAFFSRRASTLPQPRNEPGDLSSHGNEKLSGQMVNHIYIYVYIYMYIYIYIFMYIYIYVYVHEKCLKIV